MSGPGTLFIADWVDAIFVHFAVDPVRLQRIVPLELDLFSGDAYVSLVAFTQRHLRPTIGGRLSRWLLAPLASHEFLNIRTYVRLGATRGIYFIAEWIPNRLAALIGPRAYGLPYRLGSLRYDGMGRKISAGGASLRFEILNAARDLSPCVPGTFDHFLLERYTAFTHRAGVTRRFDVDHAPWPKRRVDVRLGETTLLDLPGDWRRGARFLAAHYSPGVFDVRIGAPAILDPPSSVLGFTPTASAATDQ
jgi:uncharacterized protein YqjF (DUF2071 family)